ncbi:hypothetical protein HHK36_027852 [Tetracentron sinense]|uniref:RNA uridylyltransferase n=1 Tax=Tetracentron sinense TaxID=13715 RepID=A0A835D1L4_TETSI|nr:hypothetical protein HHK36_027852 [Tetracentron sinense]
MTGGGGASPPSPSPPLPAPTSGGEFLLQLLQKPHQSQTPSQLQTTNPNSETPSLPFDPHYRHDPAVAAIGPTVPFPPWPSNGLELQTPWPSSTRNTPYSPNFHLPGFPHNPWGLPGFPPPGVDGIEFHRRPQFPGNHPLFGNDPSQRLGLLGSIGIGGKPEQQQQQQQQQQQKQPQTLMFGSLACELRSNEGLSNGSSSDPRGRGVDRENAQAQFGDWKDHGGVVGSRSSNGSEIRSQHSVNSNRNWQFDHGVNSRGPQKGNNAHFEHGWDRQQHVAVHRSAVPEVRPAPPGFVDKPKGAGRWDSGDRRRDLEHNVYQEEGSQGELNHRGFHFYEENEKIRRQSPEHHGIQGDAFSRMGLSGQLDHPGPPTGSNLQSVSASDIEESLANLHSGIVEKGGVTRFQRQEKTNRDEAAYGKDSRHENDDLTEQLKGSLMLRDGFDIKNGVRQYNSSRDKDLRSDDFKGQRPLVQQRMRNFKRQMECRSDIERLNAPFLAIYESLIPAEEEKTKQKQLLTSLEKLVNKEWPKAQLFLYGSCANSFGVSRSDVDVCLAIDDTETSKSEILLKLADILQSDNLQNVQALTRARVPIVKLMDPVTGISCDICINNVLAVVNTKLLRDYAQIDARLQQLAFIVKHWAKTRGVNETYRGTLSSYAYVIMCIHFLQRRKPAILPCLQGMETTYAVTVDDIECSYFDRVENLRNFGSQNKESIAQLVWAFFDYWAYRHDYANAVISVRTGSIIRKHEKDWTRRIGNDRHLICIEDPFEISHDLGRVVDKYSIKVLREEFERAANIMQYDPDPCAMLFEPYVRG